MIVGYTTGVFDLFHVGHLNILKVAKMHCDYLIVGVTTDDLCIKLKNKRPLIPFEERMQILESIRYVDRVVSQDIIDEVGDWRRLHFNRIFKGSDWKGTTKWVKLDREFSRLNVEVFFFDYTQNTSSSLIREVLEREYMLGQLKK